MKFNPYILLIVASLVLAPDLVLAQSTDEEMAVLVLTGENKQRKVAGAVNTECGKRVLGFRHSPPWGNWGVDSNYGTRSDTTQFRGWRWDDGSTGKRQWNSCTTNNSDYLPPNCTYYNAENCYTQASEGTVAHGVLSYRTRTTPCPADGTHGGEQGIGCRTFEGARAIQSSNYMTLYELDNNGDDLVETLYFGRTALTLSGCSHNSCPPRTTGWLNLSRSSSDTARVEAKFRMKAHAELHGFCDWN